MTPVLVDQGKSIRSAMGNKSKFMAKVKFFNSILMAEAAKNLLKEHGIEALVQKRGLEFPGDLGDSYGADLFVTEEDIEKAKEILKDNHSE